MNGLYNSLQLREVFHLEFLRWFGKKVKAECYGLKGGSNLRFFFNSFRYSEDMDLDAHGIKKDILCDVVMNILKAAAFKGGLKSFGIEDIVSPDITKAKQTQTTQRFKIHLITSAGEDLFTKIEFSRRGFSGEIIAQPVSDIVTRQYKIAPLLVPHYNIQSAIMQKIDALALRAIIQVRDIFDLYILSSQYEHLQAKALEINNSKLNKAYNNIFEISFEQFRDTVLSYLAPEDQNVYKTASSWDEVKLKAANFIDELKEKYA